MMTKEELKALAPSLKVEEWDFFAKGQAHAVFRYVAGDASSAWNGLVVRFVRNSGGPDNFASDIEHCFHAIEWLREKMFCTVGDCMDLPVPATVTPEVAAQFTEKAGMSLAPAFDIMPDYSQCDLLVELKPKKGVIFASDAWCDQDEELTIHDPLLSQCCKHCIQQTTKVASGRFDTRSLYCPVTLFEGKIDEAFHNLFQVPQNNLRIFKDGKDMDLPSIPREEQERITAECKTALTATNMLDRVLTLMRAIPLDIAVLHEAKDKGSETIAYIHKEETLCRVQEMSEAGGPASTEVTTREVTETKTVVPLQDAIDAYFISRSAQDASIMIQLFKDKPPQAKIIDLDKKSDEKFKFWKQQEQDLVSAFKSSL